MTNATSDRLAEAPRGEEVVHQQRRLARSGRALERGGGHAHDHPTSGEVGQHLAQGEGAGHRVELVPRLDQSRRGRRVEIGAEGDDQDVAVERAGVGFDPAAGRVDGTDRRLHEANPRLHQIAVGVQHGFGDRPAEHHVELREAEHEALALVDQHHLSRVAELVRQPGGQLESAEAGTEHDDLHDVLLHSICGVGSVD